MHCQASRGAGLKTNVRVGKQKTAFVGDNYNEPLSLADERESFTFADWAYLRIIEDRIEVQGDMRTLRLPVKGKPELIINGEEKKASFERGYLYYRSP